MTDTNTKPDPLGLESKYKNLINTYKDGITIELLKNKEEFKNYAKIRYDWIEFYYLARDQDYLSLNVDYVLDRDDYHFLKTVNYTLPSPSFFFHKDIVKLIKDYEENYKCNLC
jgi:hypothetical protein